MAIVDAGEPEVYPGFPTWRLRGLHIAVIAGIAVSALTQIASGYYPLASGASHPRGLAGDGVYAALGLMSQVALCTAGVLFVIWLWRARKNLDALRGSTATLGAGWAIAGWLIPIANLFIPYHMMAQVTRSSTAGKGMWLVYGWWAGYICQALSLAVVLVVDNWIVVAAVTAVFWLIAGCFLAAIVVTVTTAQHSKLDKVSP